MTPTDRNRVRAACREILRGHVADRLLDDVAASCPSIEHARLAIEHAKRRHPKARA